jgi:hypothetical protein
MESKVQTAISCTDRKLYDSLRERMEQRWDETMGQTAISCTDRKLPGSLPELRLTRIGWSSSPRLRKDFSGFWKFGRLGSRTPKLKKKPGSFGPQERKTVSVSTRTSIFLAIGFPPETLQHRCMKCSQIPPPKSITRPEHSDFPNEDQSPTQPIKPGTGSNIHLHHPPPPPPSRHWTSPTRLTSTSTPSKRAGAGHMSLVSEQGNVKSEWTIFKPFVWLYTLISKRD